jgi:hypothetical protein
MAKHSQRVESLLNIDEQIKEFYKLRKSRFFVALAMEYFARVLSSVEILFILNAINININIFHAIYINAFSSLVMNIAFFMPMELGSREAGMFVSIGSIVPDPSIGIYVSVVNRLRELFWILTGLLCIRLYNIQFPFNKKIPNTILNTNNEN